MGVLKSDKEGIQIIIIQDGLQRKKSLDQISFEDFELGESAEPLNSIVGAG
tara:strand:- start:934 stop:1086 length:153 start_codon:yes stop_codon:yes gene_type:complete